MTRQPGRFWERICGRGRETFRATPPRQHQTLIHNFRTGEILPPARTQEQEVELIRFAEPHTNRRLAIAKPETKSANVAVA